MSALLTSHTVQQRRGKEEYSLLCPIQLVRDSVRVKHTSHAVANDGFAFHESHKMFMYDSKFLKDFAKRSTTNRWAFFLID